MSRKEEILISQEEEKNEIKSKQKKNENKGPIPMSRKMRWIVYVFLIIIIIIMGFDQGIISGSTTSLKKDMEMTERVLGGFGSMVFLGNSIGCVVLFALINKFNRKHLLLLSMIFDVISLFLTTLTTNFILLYLYRVIAGFTQSFLSIYSPVWSDQFGIHKYKSIMLSGIHIFSSFGFLGGYALGTLIGWKISFHIQNFLIIILVITVFIFIPDKYFSMNLIPLKSKLSSINLKENKAKNDEDSKIKNLIKDINEINIDNNKIEEDDGEKLINENKDEKDINNEGEIVDQKDKKEKKEEKKEEKEEEKEEDNESLFEDIQKNNDDIQKEPILTLIKVLIKSPIYLLMNILLTSIFIIVSAVQFWINDYLENSLNITDKNTRLYAFIAIIVTSPVGGILLGGLLSGKIGGYDTEKAIYIPLIGSFLVSVLANIIPLTTNLYFFIPLFWLYLFLGSTILPVSRGMVLVSVDKKYSGSANSASTLILSVLGKLPGPNLYAFYKSIVNNESSRIPFWLLLNMASIGFLTTLFCLKFQKQKYKNLRKENNKIELKEIIINKNEEITTEDNEEKEINNEVINEKMDE